MSNKIDIELITMPPQNSQCTSWHEVACVFTNDSMERKGVPWGLVSEQEFTLQNDMSTVLLDGYNHCNPAVYLGVNNDNEAVYAIYKKSQV